MTADGKLLMVVAITPRQWSGLLKALELGDAVAGIEAALGVSFTKDEGLRFQHRDMLTPLVQAAIARRNSDQLGPADDANGVCWGPHHTLKAALTDEPRLVTGNRLFSPVAHPSGQTYPTPRRGGDFGSKRAPGRHARAALGRAHRPSAHRYPWSFRSANRPPA